MPQFHHFLMCNQNESTSILVIFRQNTKVIALLLGQRWLIVITFQCAITINQFQFWSFLSKMPKAIALLFGQKCLIFITFNVQSKWINVNFGHFSANYQSHSLRLGQKCLIFITFQCGIKINQILILSFLSKISRL